MTKEQEETIKKLEYYLQNSAYKRVDSDFFKNGGWEIVDLEIPQAIETGLNIIKIKDKEIEKKDKMIDLLIKYVDELSEYYARFVGRNKFCDEKCIDNSDVDCYECIKQYFERKAKDGRL